MNEPSITNKQANIIGVLAGALKGNGGRPLRALFVHKMLVDRGFNTTPNTTYQILNRMIKRGLLARKPVPSGSVGRSWLYEPSLDGLREFAVWREWITTLKISQETATQLKIEAA
jgi:Fe2+ or Zn2+ uptake regulation protein